jgi:hypothetical protein
MSERLRFLALYGWQELFDMAAHPEVFVRLVEEAGITPTKVGVAIPGEKRERRRTLYKKSRLIDVITPFTSYDSVSLEEPIERDFANARSHFSLDQHRRRYVLAKVYSAFDLNDALRHVRLFCEFMTPRYGFVHSEYGLAALVFPHGIATTSLPQHVWRRVGDLGHSLHRTKEHLNGKLHDVYGLNVLSPLHFDWLVRGQPLRDWIGEADAERSCLSSPMCTRGSFPMR